MVGEHLSDCRSKGSSLLKLSESGRRRSLTAAVHRTKPSHSAAKSETLLNSHQARALPSRHQRFIRHPCASPWWLSLAIFFRTPLLRPTSPGTLLNDWFFTFDTSAVRSTFALWDIPTWLQLQRWSDRRRWPQARRNNVSASLCVLGDAILAKRPVSHNPVLYFKPRERSTGHSWKAMCILQDVAGNAEADLRCSRLARYPCPSLRGRFFLHPFVHCYLRKSRLLLSVFFLPCLVHCAVILYSTASCQRAGLIHSFNKSQDQSD